MYYLITRCVSWRRVLSIGGFEARGVIHRRRAPLPSGLDRGQHGAVVQVADVERHVGRRISLVAAFLVVQGARVGGVEVHVLEGNVAGPGPHGIARLVGHELEYVGADVEAAEGVQVPVGLGGGDLAVVVVVVVIGGADEVGRDGVAEEDGEDPVLDRVGLVLVKRDQNQSVLHEALVREKRLQKGTGPLACHAHVGVVAVACHVRRDEHPLWERLSFEVLIECYFMLS